MYVRAQSIAGHSASPSGSVWWFQHRAATISFIPPPKDRLVRQTSYLGPTYNYLSSAAPAMPNVAGGRSGRVAYFSMLSMRSSELLRTPFPRASVNCPSERDSLDGLDLYNSVRQIGTEP